VPIAGAERGERADHRERYEYTAPAEGHRESRHDGAGEHAAELARAVDAPGGNRARLLTAKIEGEGVRLR
jgi:hypothetical protein